jgi:hypothetical protein
MAPVVGMPCSGLLVIAAVGSGDVSTAGEELLLGTLPGSKLLKQADNAVDVFRGGRYADLATGQTIHRHHLPADKATSVSRSNGPAIQMEIADHKATKSYGSKQHVAHLKTMIDGGQMRKAMYLEIKDVRRIGGRKYNRALLEMLDYAKRSGMLSR